MSFFNMLAPRHIQEHNASSAVTHHWGYADRQVPCTNDKGSCEYLDAVYGAHDTGMLYMGVIWATILGVLLIWAVYTFSSKGVRADNVVDNETAVPILSTTERWRKAIACWRRQYLLPDCWRTVFGRTTRTQVLALAVITGYLTIFTFAGITYQKWVTPVKNKPGVYNTRTSLGPWSDRIGVIAYALTPLSLLLSSRESLLSIITGLPYQSFNFLHRWLGYLIVVQSILHTIGWCIIEMRLYQPQPSVGLEWIQQLYMIWGVIAMFLLFVLFLLSTPWAIKWTGYEFFRKSHYVLAMLYIGAAIGHWKQLQCFLIPALVVWFVDRAVRLIRTGLLHYKIINGREMAFQSTEATITSFPDSVNGDVVRLEMQHQQEPWHVGQHFYLCFPQSSMWQSHPFTPLNAPMLRAGTVQHSYVFRARKGETRRIAQFAKTASTTPVILNGPYGVNEIEDLTGSTNILCVAGGTGIAYVLPVLLSQIGDCKCSSTRKLQLVWAIRCQSDMEWVRPELDRLYAAARAMDLKISIYVTRESPVDEKNAIADKATFHSVDDKLESSSSSSSTGVAAAEGDCCKTSVQKDLSLCSPQPPRRNSVTVQRRGSLGAVPAESRHPDLAQILASFIETTVQGSTTVYASGPGGMVSDLRQIVANCNSGSKVLKGDLRSCVELKCDDRLEW